MQIAGRVQGVWYRASTQAEAERLGLTGWVRNLPDGRVEAQAQGREQQVEALVRWCHGGPPQARVSGVERAEIPELSGERGFLVRR